MRPFLPALNRSEKQLNHDAVSPRVSRLLPPGWLYGLARIAVGGYIEMPCSSCSRVVLTTVVLDDDGRETLEFRGDYEGANLDLDIVTCVACVTAEMPVAA